MSLEPAHREESPTSSGVHIAPEDALRFVRKIGLGLLLACLLGDSAEQHLVRWRSRLLGLQYRVLPDIVGPGAILANIAIEILEATPG